MSSFHSLYSILPASVVSPSHSHSHSLPSLLASLNSHQCRIFDVPSLLFDQRWIGTDRVKIEIAPFVGDSESPPRAVLCTARSALPVFVDRCQPIKLRGHQEGERTLVLDEIMLPNQPNDQTAKSIDSDALLSLAPYCLWAEPNKFSRLPFSDKIHSTSQTAASDSPFYSLIESELSSLATDSTILSRILQRQSSLAVLYQLQEKRMIPDLADRLKPLKQQLEALENRKKILSAIIEGNAKANAKKAAAQPGLDAIHSVHCCAICSRILLIAGQEADEKTSQTAPNERQQTIEEMDAELAELSSRIEMLQIKLKECTGGEAKQRRKKLARKQKECAERKAEIQTKKQMAIKLYNEAEQQKSADARVEQDEKK